MAISNVPQALPQALPQRDADGRAVLRFAKGPPPEHTSSHCGKAAARFVQRISSCTSTSTGAVANQVPDK
jgi:hypothetical protein